MESGKNVEMASAYSFAVSIRFGIWSWIILIRYWNGLIRIRNVFTRNWIAIE